MSVEVQNLYRLNNDNKLSTVTKRATRDLACGFLRKEMKIRCVTATVVGYVDDIIIVFINHDYKSMSCSGTGGNLPACFQARSFRVGFMVEKLALREFCLRVLRFCSQSIPLQRISLPFHSSITDAI
jgi:hypothetical protein